MSTRLTWPGTAAYAVAAVVQAITAIWMIRQDGPWGGDQAWAAACILACAALSGVLCALAGITRQPLVDSDGPFLLRKGGLLIIGLTVVAMLVVMASDFDDFGLWPTSPAVFVPFGIRRLETAYREGVEEGRQIAEARAAERQKAGTPPQLDDQLGE